MQGTTQTILFSAITVAAVLTGAAPAVGAAVPAPAEDEAAWDIGRDELLADLADRFDEHDVRLSDALLRAALERSSEAGSDGEDEHDLSPGRLGWDDRLAADSWGFAWSGGEDHRTPADVERAIDPELPAVAEPAVRPADAAGAPSTEPVAEPDPEARLAAAAPPAPEATEIPERAASPGAPEVPVPVILPDDALTEAYLSALASSGATAAGSGPALTARAEPIGPIGVVTGLGVLGVLALAIGHPGSRHGSSFRQDLRLAFRGR